jgi:hypothetical protein
VNARKKQKIDTRAEKVEKKARTEGDLEENRAESCA